MQATTTGSMLGKFAWTLAGLVLIAGIGALDFITGYEIGFSLFYLLPISLVVWRAGRWAGLTTSIFGALTWLAADFLAGQTYSHPGIYYWNTGIRLGFFSAVALLMATVRKNFERERELARTDSLTGAINNRSFHELLQAEIDRYQRYERPFSLAYLDLDDFKTINDHFGHLAGDQVLRAVAANIQAQLRNSDVLARLGGDEFALLLPETDPQAAAVVLPRILSALAEEMDRNAWGVSFSIGVITCMGEIENPEALIHLADEVMYAAKRKSKNAINYAVYSG